VKNRLYWNVDFSCLNEMSVIELTQSDLYQITWPTNYFHFFHHATHWHGFWG